MASGYGITGGTSRCFPFWQDLLQCYALNTNSSSSSPSGTVPGGSSDDGKWKCIPQRDDYFECLHHKKEIAKTRAVREAYIKYEIENPGFGGARGTGAGPIGGGAAGAGKSAREGGVKGLGLLGKEE